MPSFYGACGISSETNRRLRVVDFYTSHEALHLPFEQAMTRVDSTTGDYHDTSAHFVWIGDRTRQPEELTLNFVEELKIQSDKCGPSLTADELIRLINILNPTNESGRITLISRFGADLVESGLPKLVRPLRKKD